MEFGEEDEGSTGSLRAGIRGEVEGLDGLRVGFVEWEVGVECGAGSFPDGWITTSMIGKLDCPQN